MMMDMIVSYMISHKNNSQFYLCSKHNHLNLVEFECYHEQKYTHP